MKIIILDPVFLKDRHITELQLMGKVKRYDTFPESNEILRRVKNADIIITASTDINRRVLNKCNKVKMICQASTGYDRIDLKAANELGIALTNAPNYATDAVAEHTFALIFTLIKKIREGDLYMRKGGADWRHLQGVQLKGKVFGVIGMGAIGSRVAHLANCFGCDVVANTSHPLYKSKRRFRVQYVKLEALLKKSDIISIHIPLSQSTRGMIGQKEFYLMERKPVLLNTSRVEIIDYDALVTALSKSLISGVGLDASSHSLPKHKNELVKFKNVVFSPHIAFYTPEALDNCADIVVENIRTFIKGNPQNLVNNPPIYK